MKAMDAYALGRKLMNQHGLSDWTIELDRAKRRFGVCRYTSKRIGLSKILVELNNEKQVKDTLLHEIAHALVSHGDGHNNVWKQKALEIGCAPSRTYDDTVVRPQSKFTGTCPNCGKTARAERRPSPTMSCGECCRNFNSNKWSIEYRFAWKEN